MVDSIELHSVASRSTDAAAIHCGPQPEQRSFGAGSWLKKLSMLPRLQIRLDSQAYPPGVAYKEFALLFGFFLAGWIDATPGGLLPAIQAHYGVSFVVVSMLFVCNLVGSIMSSVLCPIAVDRLGMGKTLALSSTLGLIPPVLIIPRPPFPLIAFAMVLSGLAMGTQNSLSNVWISARPRANVRLGVLHFLYGVGALCSPLGAIPFVDEDSQHSLSFNYFYCVTLGIAFVNMLLLNSAWRLRKDPLTDNIDGVDAGHAASPSPKATPASLPYDAEDIQLEPLALDGSSKPHTPTEEKIPSKPQTTGDKFRTVLRNKNVHILAAFTLLYVGTEVSIGGWSSTFLIEVRHERKATNALISGFWAGIALGRVLLIPVTSRIGLQTATLVYLLASIGLQFTVWFVPQIVANAVCLALQGLFLGPIFPIMVDVASRKVKPRSLLTTAISFICSFAASGSALFPFIIGLAAQTSSQGIKILAPILMSLLAAQFVVWSLLGVPKFWKRGAEADLDDNDRLD